MIKKFCIGFLIKLLWIISYTPLWFRVSISRISEFCLRVMAYLNILDNVRIGYNMIRTNLKLCFPEKSKKEINKLTYKNVQEAVLNILNYGLILSTNPDRLRKIIKIKNIEIFEKYYQKRPIIVLFPHFWGLELGGVRMGLDFLGYANMQDKNILPHQYKVFGGVMERLNAARIKLTNAQLLPLGENMVIAKIIKDLKKTNGALYYPMDEGGHGVGATYAPFFSHPYCSVNNKIYQMAKIANAVLLVMVCFRKGNCYEVEISEPFEHLLIGDAQNDARVINHAIEQMILRAPTQYKWDLQKFGIQPGFPDGFLYIEKELNEYFDPVYYTQNNPNAKGAEIPLLQHYLRYGWCDGYSPSALFDVKYYLANNPDIVAAGVEPFCHYLMYGKKEGRKCTS